jgi:DNA/RNA-binding domain of Phe-tRNA-synthetase-like protein
MNDLLAVAPEVFDVIPGLQVVVVVAHDIAAPDLGGVDARWSAAWSRVHTSFGFPNPQSHPHVSAWRLAMKGAGAFHKEYPTSVEALVRRALKSPLPVRINPLVDFYNSVSLELVVPAGGYDLDALASPLELRLSRPGDTFEALDASTSEAVPPGELAYTAGDSVVTRHLVWRQSRLGLVTAATRSALFLSELLPSQAPLIEVVQRALASGLRVWFRASVHSAVLSQSTPVLSGSYDKH